MYNNFLFRIAFKQNIISVDLPSIYHWVHSYDKIDKDKYNIPDSLIEKLKQQETLSDDEISSIAKDPIASLIYMSDNESEALTRRDKIKSYNTNIFDKFLQVWDLMAYYIVFVLNSDVKNDEDFINKCISVIQHNPTYVAQFIDITKYINTDLAKIIESWCMQITNQRELFETETGKILNQIVDILTISPELVENFNTFLGKNYRFLRWFKNIVNHRKDNAVKNIDTAKNIWNINLSEDNLFNRKFKELNTYLDDLLTSTKDKNYLSNKIENYMKTLSTDKKKKIVELISNIDTMKSTGVLDKEGYDFLIFMKALKIKAGYTYKSRLVKAYTNYYIKNYLPGLLKKAAPNMLPQIVTTGTQEVQNLMFNDNRLYEFDNPSITKQISQDLTSATNKPDLISGGAADGMSIEDIAQQWAPKYNIDYYQMLDILKKQLEYGKLVELEHTDNEDMAEEIAKDHLTEAADYYSYLENMEQLFPENNVAKKSEHSEDANFEPVFLQSPDKKEGHQCDGFCDGNCHYNHDIKPQTVEDKIKSLNNLADEGGSIIVTVISDAEPTQEEVFSNSVDAADDYIKDIAANIQR